jgi:hypothetical protein
MSNLPIEIIREIVSYISPNIDLRRALGMYSKICTSDFASIYMPVENQGVSKTTIGFHDYGDFLSGRRRILPVQYHVEREIQNKTDNILFRYPVRQDCVVADIIVNPNSVYQELGIFIMHVGPPPSETHENIFPVYNLPNVYWSAVFSEYIRR